MVRMATRTVRATDSLKAVVMEEDVIGCTLSERRDQIQPEHGKLWGKKSGGDEDDSD